METTKLASESITEQDWVELYQWIRNGLSRTAIPKGHEKVAKLILHAVITYSEKIEEIKNSINMFTAAQKSGIESSTCEELVKIIYSIAIRED